MKAQYLLKARFIKGITTVFLLFGLHITSLAQNEFITTWKTNTANQEVTIPTFPGDTYNYTVDWGDGTIDTNVTGNKSHTYETTVVHTVKISGTFPRIYFNIPKNNTNPYFIKSIEHWGTNSWTSMNNAFSGCAKLVNNADDVPDLSGVTDMSSMFKAGINGSELGNGTATNWNSWNTSKVTNMSSLFYQAKNFNKDIASWNTAKVTNMSKLFYNALKFNKDISNWDAGAVTDMQSMFTNASLFNQDIGSWNTSKVTNMSFMFFRAYNFSKDLNSWNTAKVTKMNSMFREAFVFNNTISDWNTSSVTTMEQMFYEAKIFNQNIGAWNTSAVTTMEGMFGLAYNFNKDINTWNTGAVIDMSGMFYKARDFNQSLNSWNTENTTNMNGMFSNASSFNGAIGNWNTSKVKFMGEMFRNSPKFNQDINSWNTSSLTSSSFMFFEAFAFNQNLSNWDMSNNTSMSNMFYGAMVFNQNISGWNTAKVTDMNSMFIGAIAFDQNVGNWNVAAVGNMTNMFNGVTLSTENYDALLIGWNGQTLKSGVTFSGGSSKYCSEDAQNARKDIIKNYGWTINDSGLSIGCTTASLNDYSLDNSILLYPNSVVDILTIKSNNSLQKITLRDINSRVILEASLDNQKETSISLSKLATGIYFAKITSGKGQLVKKIIKK